MTTIGLLISMIETIRKDWIDYTLSSTTITGFLAFQESIGHEFYWIPVSVGVLTLVKLALDIYKSIQNLKIKKKRNETQDNQ